MDIKTLEDLKNAYPDLMAEFQQEIEADIDSKIAIAVTEMKSELQEQAEDAVIEIYEEKRQQDLDQLRGIVEAICSVPGVIPEEEEDNENDAEESEEEVEDEETKEG